uniref:Uncharacterized protein n=1 Tax=Bombyx mori TaxID=7091 RepID=A0A8R2R7I8_BOMMO|nr:uncharacterized protein LOC101739999 isoform X3 [Bombyx mori]
MCNIREGSGAVSVAARQAARAPREPGATPAGTRTGDYRSTTPAYRARPVPAGVGGVPQRCDPQVRRGSTQGGRPERAGPPVPRRRVRRPAEPRGAGARVHCVQQRGAVEGGGARVRGAGAAAAAAGAGRRAAGPARRRPHAQVHPPEAEHLHVHEGDGGVRAAGEDQPPLPGRHLPTDHSDISRPAPGPGVDRELERAERRRRGGRQGADARVQSEARAAGRLHPGRRRRGQHDRRCLGDGLRTVRLLARVQLRVGRARDALIGLQSHRSPRAPEPPAGLRTLLSLSDRGAEQVRVPAAGVRAADGAAARGRVLAADRRAEGEVEFHNGRAAHTSDDGGAALLRAARVDVPVRQHPAAAAAAHGARPPHLPPGRRGGPLGRIIFKLRERNKKIFTSGKGRRFERSAKKNEEIASRPLHHHRVPRLTILQTN